MKEVIELIKRIYSNKRYRAVGILIIYFVFFFFVFLLLSSNNTNKPLTGLDLFKTINNYEYKIEGNINYKTEVNSITDEYYINIYTPKNIYKLIKLGTLESTNHIENSNTYVVKISELEKLFNNKIENDNNFKITTYKENQNITKVVIDVKEYYGYIVTIEM